MWNLVFDSLLDKFEEGHVMCCGYADDAALLIAGDKPHFLVDQMNRAIDKALEWGRENGLTFSAPKTVCILFNRLHKVVQPPQVKMNRALLPYQNSVRYS